MTNENLKVDIEMILYDLNTVKVAGEVGGNPDSFLAKSANQAINLIKSQQSRIEILESAIRDFLKCDLRCELSSFNHESCEGEDELRYIARTNLEKLMENKS